MMNKSTLSKLLTAAVLLSFCTSAASCGDKQNLQPDTDNESTVDTTSQDSELTLPRKDFGGKTFNIFVWRGNKLVTEEENGDVINDAVYRRNSLVEDLYNVNFTYDVRQADHGGTHEECLAMINASIMANDDAYQLVGGYAYRLAQDSLSGNFQNLNANKNIDFSGAWWPSNLVEASNLGGNVTIAFGNIDPLYYDSTYVNYFNKQLAEDNSVGDLYALVNEGKWTIDKLIELSKAGTKDLNGDSKIDENDQFGYVLENCMCVDAFINSCDITMTEFDTDRIPKLVGLTEKYVSLQEKLTEFFYNSGDVSYSNGYDLQPKLFMDGQALFLSERMGLAHTLREMKDDFGILPYPKYDESQKQYYTYNAAGNTTGFVIPITADEEMSGCILEALAFYGWRDVLPEYFERALKGKAARDAESAEMLELIFNNITFEFTQVYSFSFGDEQAPSMLLRTSIRGREGISSMWASKQGLFDSTMEKLIETLK